MEKIEFFESKKNSSELPVPDKNLILGGMLGLLMGHHMQKEWNFYLAVQARNKFFTVLTIGKWMSQVRILGNFWFFGE